MATLIDERNEVEADDLEQEAPVGQHLQEEQDESAPVSNNEEETDELPDKYRGKSVKDLVQMHQEAEKALGKHGSEVGELRKIVDNYIQTQLTENKADDQPAEEAPDWFADPDKAFDYKLNNHPKIKEAEQTTKEYQRSTALQRLKADHPDMENIVNQPGFAAWIKQSPVRQKLFLQADQEYNYDAAHELFSTWKQIQGVNKDVTESDKQQRKEKVKEASTGNARGSNAPSRKKVYRRADIMRLRETDRERYNAMSDEILQAYKEGRVV